MRAVLVICEGRSDVAFVCRSLISISECRRFSGEIRHLPSPFGGLRNSSSDGVIVEHIKKSFGIKVPEDEQRLQRATFLSPPQFDDAIWDYERDVIYLVVNSGGRDQHGAILDLLRRVSLASRFRGLDVTESAIAFLLDANDRGEATTLEDFCGRYGKFFGGFSIPTHARWMKTPKFPVGAFICSGSDGKGGLEDHMVPIVISTWPERFEAACEFVDQNRQESDKVSQTRTNRQKAIISSVGQFDFPGDSIYSVISDDNGIPDVKFGESDACKALVKFLQGVQWMGV